MNRCNILFLLAATWVTLLLNAMNRPLGELYLPALIDKDVELKYKVEDAGDLSLQKLLLAKLFSRRRELPKSHRDAFEALVYPTKWQSKQLVFEARLDDAVQAGGMGDMAFMHNGFFVHKRLEYEQGKEPSGGMVHFWDLEEYRYSQRSCDQIYAGNCPQPQCKKNINFSRWHIPSPARGYGVIVRKNIITGKCCASIYRYEDVNAMDAIATIPILTQDANSKYDVKFLAETHLFVQKGKKGRLYFFDAAKKTYHQNYVFDNRDYFRILRNGALVGTHILSGDQAGNVYIFNCQTQQEHCFIQNVDQQQGEDYSWGAQVGDCEACYITGYHTRPLLKEKLLWRYDTHTPQIVIRKPEDRAPIALSLSRNGRYALATAMLSEYDISYEILDLDKQLSLGYINVPLGVGKIWMTAAISDDGNYVLAHAHNMYNKKSHLQLWRCTPDLPHWVDYARYTEQEQLVQANIRNAMAHQNRCLTGKVRKDNLAALSVLHRRKTDDV